MRRTKHFFHKDVGSNLKHLPYAGKNIFQFKESKVLKRRIEGQIRVVTRWLDGKRARRARAMQGVIVDRGIGMGVAIHELRGGGGKENCRRHAAGRMTVTRMHARTRHGAATHSRITRKRQRREKRGGGEDANTSDADCVERRRMESCKKEIPYQGRFMSKGVRNKTMNFAEEDYTRFPLDQSTDLSIYIFC